MKLRQIFRQFLNIAMLIFGVSSPDVLRRAHRRRERFKNLP